MPRAHVEHESLLVPRRTNHSTTTIMSGDDEKAAAPDERTAPPVDQSNANPVMHAQLNFADSLLRGKSLLVHGGTWTAEARETNRRKKVLEQLKLARKLRATLEHAADQAEQLSQNEARSLLLQHAPDISVLASLTEAVKGKYTLESYDYYNRKAQQQQQNRQEEIKRARAVLNQHVETMVAQKTESEEQKTTSRRAAPPPKRREPPKKPKAKKPPPKQVKKAGRDRIKAAPPRIPTHALMTMGGGSHNSSSRPTRAAAVASKPIIESSSSEEDEEDLLQVAPRTTKSGRRPNATRQCHDCKSTTKLFRECNYWQPDGSQCGKTFCRTCIEGKYEGPYEDWDAMLSQLDWHCPSCLGTCLCQYCTNKRQMRGFGLGY